jgi:hypothetical protein
MNKTSLRNDYLTKYAAPLSWALHAKSVDDIKQVVVIPAYAEKEMLFETLASLAANPDACLKETLILCVINNKAAAPEKDRENNSHTIAILDGLIHHCSLGELSFAADFYMSIENIAASSIRLAYIDASSPGLEIPSHVGGVGMARKIGMDMALRLLQNTSDPLRLIMSLDADTLVRDDYLPAVRNVFTSGRFKTGVISYAHQMPSQPDIQKAICAYEIFLRYFLLGLRYAGSPYAFHSIGSTMVTTDDAYLAVRGMNRREAGEDFYFLNKLAKIGPIHTIRETKVYPSARISIRVPFGTGSAVDKMTSGLVTEQRFYDPIVFQVVKDWLMLMEQSFSCSENQILTEARNIHSGLADFLMARKFPTVWTNIRSNLKDLKTYKRQFHNWFDGFETLKLINHLTGEYYPRIAMMPALKMILDGLGIKGPEEIHDDLFLALDNQFRLLNFLRTQT